MSSLQEEWTSLTLSLILLLFDFIFGNYVKETTWSKYNNKPGFRSSLPKVFLVGKCVLKICSKFTCIFSEHLLVRTPIGVCFWGLNAWIIPVLSWSIFIRPFTKSMVLQDKLESKIIGRTWKGNRYGKSYPVIRVVKKSTTSNFLIIIL